MSIEQRVRMPVFKNKQPQQQAQAKPVASPIQNRVTMPANINRELKKADKEVEGLARQLKTLRVSKSLW
jgi:hypothetical protein